MRAGNPLELDALTRHGDPPPQMLVLREQLQDRLVGGGDVLRVTGEGGPPERAETLFELRPDVGRHETGKVEGTAVTRLSGFVANRVAVVEDLGALVEEADHRGDLLGHRLLRLLGEVGRILLRHLLHVLEVDPDRQIGQRVVRRGLIGDDVDGCVAFEQGGKDLGGVADHSDRQRALGISRLDGLRQRVVEVGGLDVEIPLGDAPVDARLVHVDADRDAFVHGDRQRLRTTHAADATGEGDGAGEAAAELLLGDRPNVS